MDTNTFKDFASALKGVKLTFTNKGEALSGDEVLSFMRKYDSELAEKVKAWTDAQKEMQDYLNKRSEIKPMTINWNFSV